jgi:ASCH domain.
MTIKVHPIKIAPKYLNAVVAGQKKAELRKNDRNYKVGDILSLKEWKHGKYTGREWSAVITHVLPVGEVVTGLDSWVVLSINAMSLFDVAIYIYENGGIAALLGAENGR